MSAVYPGGMELQSIPLEPIQKTRVAVLGYGNQGRAQALCLRDSGVDVTIGLRESGATARLAREDGFIVRSFSEAVSDAEVVVFLLPDQVIPEVYRSIRPQLKQTAKILAFAHGFVVTFGWIEFDLGARYFLVSPKGAGAILRSRFLEGTGLPGVYALSDPEDVALRALALAYAKAIGCASSILIETKFREETESDLFGEQAVLCGGIMELMRAAFETAVSRGHSREMAFFETCYEARLILELWIRFGPDGMAQKISPTAFFGGLTRGKRLITEETRREIGRIFDEVRSGAFAEEWKQEIEAGYPQSKKELEAIRKSELTATFKKLSPFD